jgi:hypothetical protein
MKNKMKITIVVATIFSVLLLTSCTPLSSSKTSKSSDISASPSSQTEQEKKSSTSNSLQSVAKTTEPANTTAGVSNSTAQAADSTMNTQKTQKTNGLQLSPSIEQIKVKAVYLTGPSGGMTSKVDKIIALANTTELNTVVLDIKEDGSLNYESSLDVVKKYGAEIKYYNPEKLIKKFHDNGVYVIGRIVTFRDRTLAKKRADLGIKTPKGTLWL